MRVPLIIIIIIISRFLFTVILFSLSFSVFTFARQFVCRHAILASNSLSLISRSSLSLVFILQMCIKLVSFNSRGREIAFFTDRFSSFFLIFPAESDAKCYFVCSLLTFNIQISHHTVCEGIWFVQIGNERWWWRRVKAVAFTVSSTSFLSLVFMKESFFLLSLSFFSLRSLFIIMLRFRWWRWVRVCRRRRERMRIKQTSWASRWCVCLPLHNYLILSPFSRLFGKRLYKYSCRYVLLTNPFCFKILLTIS